MSEEKVNEIRMHNLSVLSGGTSDSDDGSEEMNDEIPEEPLLKMVKCTTEHIIWDVETGSPIETKYGVSQNMWTFSWTIQLEKKVMI